MPRFERNLERLDRANEVLDRLLTSESDEARRKDLMALQNIVYEMATDAPGTTTMVDGKVTKRDGKPA